MAKYFNHLGYNRDLKKIARKLRNDSTPAEIRLWTKLLRAKQMKGYQFLRQRPFLNYIAYFMCKELRLIIEVDEENYEQEYHWYKDELRQKELEEYGFTIIRFWMKKYSTIWKMYLELLNIGSIAIPRRPLRRGNISSSGKRVVSLTKHFQSKTS